MLKTALVSRRAEQSVVTLDLLAASMSWDGPSVPSRAVGSSGAVSSATFSAHSVIWKMRSQMTPRGSREAPGLVKSCEVGAISVGKEGSACQRGFGKARRALRCASPACARCPRGVLGHTVAGVTGLSQTCDLRVLRR